MHVESKATELDFKSLAARLVANCPGLSPDEVAADLLEAFERKGVPLPVDAKNLATWAAGFAVQASKYRKKKGMDEPFWEGADVSALHPAMLPLINPSQWAGMPIPERRWLLDNWIPEATTTLFTGAGGVGKSLMAQQLATHVALGKSFMGVPVKAAKALYLTCEDSTEELHRRQAAICKALGKSFENLSDKLMLSSLIDQCEPLATFAKDGVMTVTAAFDTLRATIQAAGVGFLVLDNVAHLFGGNEIVKLEVAAFLGLVNKLASRTRCTILLLGHPNKAGDAYSGNVAWENQVRSRILLETPADDGDARILSSGKSNYAKRGAALEFRWHNWAFVQPEDLPADQRAEVNTAVVATADDRAFLNCLDAATRQRRHVSYKPSSNYAPKIFAAMPEGKGHNKKAFEAAMERLISTGVIEIEADLWAGPNRHMRRGIRRAPDCAKPTDTEG